MTEEKEKKSSYRKGKTAEGLRSDIDSEYVQKVDLKWMLNKKGYKEYNENILPHVIEMFRSGLSKIAVCSRLGISIQTMKNWRNRHEDFDQICEIGETALEDYWDNIGISNLLTKDMNTQVYLFFANKFKVKEKEDVEDENKHLLDSMEKDFQKLKKQYEREH